MKRNFQQTGMMNLIQDGKIKINIIFIQKLLNKYHNKFTKIVLWKINKAPTK